MGLRHADSTTRAGLLTFGSICVTSILVLGRFGLINLLLGALGHDLLPSEFIANVALLNGKAGNGALDSLDVVHVEVDAFLEDV